MRTRRLSTWTHTAALAAAAVMMLGMLSNILVGWPTSTTIAWLAAVFVLAVFGWLVTDEVRTRWIRRDLAEFDRQVQAVGGWEQMPAEDRNAWIARLQQDGRWR